MVKGLDVFRDHFRDYTDQYLLIGGTACDLAMNAAGLDFRVTKDLDIVLCVESLNSDYVNAFWDFIRSGEYRLQEKATGEKNFYRFQKPKQKNYPFMLELFSRQPDSLSRIEGGHLTPIPLEEEIVSLSAILLDDDYYSFLKAGREEDDGLPTVGAKYLIPLKARAWMDLTTRKKSGDPVDKGDIKKHKNDVFRLYGIIDPTPVADIPEKIKAEMLNFIALMKNENIDPKSLGLVNTNKEDILNNLQRIYCRS